MMNSSAFAHLECCCCMQGILVTWCSWTDHIDSDHKVEQCCNQATKQGNQCCVQSIHVGTQMDSCMHPGGPRAFRSRLLSSRARPTSRSQAPHHLIVTDSCLQTPHTLSLGIKLRHDPFLQLVVQCRKLSWTQVLRTSIWPDTSCLQSSLNLQDSRKQRSHNTNARKLPACMGYAPSWSAHKLVVHAGW
jgi:hypothetical protein